MNEALNNGRLDTEASAEPASHLPFTLPLELTVKDAETIAELCRYEEGEPRDEFALRALRIGVLALKQARGEVDAEEIRREGDRLLSQLQHNLSQHSDIVHQQVTTVLKDYFDPQDGRFQERVNRLVQQDGELEQVLRRQIGREDSELCKTLTEHIGEESPLMKTLSPDQSEGLLAALRETFGQQLQSQREEVLKQFSLDNKEGALARFIEELEQRQGELSENLDKKIDEVVREFSLDEEDSALSRLVANVDRAQRTITAEFSLDEEKSALSRLKKILEDTNQTIDKHLSLDDEQSALARLKRELLTLLKEHEESRQKFQSEVKETLQEMKVRKEEADRSTRHGLAFEEAVYRQIQHEAQRAGDVPAHTGHTTGRIKNCKVGDCTVELGPDSAAPGAALAVEAKEEAGYQLRDARAEIETARKNRDAQVGLFVYSKRCAPDGLEPVTRLGGDVIVVWDADDPNTDLFLRTAYTLARALCVRTQEQTAAQAADFTAIDEAILEIEKRAAALDDVETWTTTIQNNSEKILKKLRTTRKSLERQVETLREKTQDLRGSLTSES